MPSQPQTSSSPRQGETGTTTTTSIANPFEDPVAANVKQNRLDVDPTSILTVDRNATLTLATDTLVVLDEGLRHRRESRNFCNFFPHLSTKQTRAIPFHHVLSAELQDFSVTIKYAKGVGRASKSCRVGYVHYTLTDKAGHAHAKRWIERLRDRAYPSGVKRRKRIKVLVNPFGGQGHAVKLYAREVEPIFAAAQCQVDVERTAYRGHAAEIAEAMDIDSFDVVAAASGDGLPHEVFNGLAKQKKPRAALRKIAVAHLPCGTGNAMSLNLNGTDSPSWAALAIIKGVSTPLDLVAITQGDKRYYSFLSQAVGIIAETDLGTENLRWMGPLRFTWGIIVRMLGQMIYPAVISVAVEADDKREIRRQFQRTVQDYTSSTTSSTPLPPTESHPEEQDSSSLPPLRYGTIQDPIPAAFSTLDHPNLGNFYNGNMPLMTAGALFFPTSLPSDGLGDLITINGTVSRLTALRMLLSVETGSLIDFPEVDYRKITGYRIVPRMAPLPDPGKGGLRKRFVAWLGGAARQKEGLIAIDGEKVPFEPFQAEVQRGLGTVISKHGPLYEDSIAKSR